MPPENDSHNFARYSLVITAIVVTATCVASANMLSVVAQNGNAPMLAFLAPKSAPATPASARTTPGQRFDNVDYGATGSVRNFLDQPVILDPCTGKQK